jgi:hypothetical protein
MATISAPTSNRLISLLPLGVAIAVVLGMHARFMADTADYAEAAISFNAESWEFGHLVWVPLCWLARTYGGLDTTGLIRAMLVFNAVACVIGVELMRRTLNGFVGTRTASVAAIVFLFSQAVLNFGLTGSSYIPGLTLTIVALYLALLRPASMRKAHAFAIGSGIAMAAAICFWFPYVLVVPGVRVHGIRRTIVQAVSAR